MTRVTSQNTDRAMSKKSPRYGSLTLYGRLLAEARPYWPHVIAFLLLSLLATPLSMLAPVPLKIAVDSFIGSTPPPRFLVFLLPNGTGPRDDTRLLLMLAGMVIAVALLTHLQHRAATLLKSYVGERLVNGWRSRLFRHVQRLSLSYHDNQGTSDST